MTKGIRCYCVLLAGLLPPLWASAQTTEKVTDLHTPSAPGFVLLGVEPTSIEKPTTPAAFATSLQSALTTSGLRPGYSLEVAPYWLKSRDKLTIEEYRNPTVGQNMLQTASVSLATSSVGTTGTGLGFGARVQLFSGKVSATEVATTANQSCLRTGLPTPVIQVIKTILSSTTSLPDTTIAAAVKNGNLVRVVERTVKDGIQSRLPKLITQVKTACPTLPEDVIEQEITDYTNACIANLRVYTGSLATRADLITWQGQLEAQLRADPAVLEIVAKEVSLDKSRQGFLWDVAGAGVLVFPSGTWDNSQFNKLGIWTTIGYDMGNVDVLGVARYLNPVGTPDSSITIDVGIKLNYSNGGRLKIGAEYLHRQYRRDQKLDAGNGFYNIVPLRKDTERVDINLKYRFTDTISITSTIGKGFNDVNFNTSNVLTILGVEYNLSEYKTASQNATN
jgi:hypothetical protein